MSIESLAADLTPSRAWKAFTACLVLGGFGAFFHWAFALVAVAAYGGLLVYSQQRAYVHLNATLKDSPYFLGFILTLFGLIGAFLTVSRSPDGVAQHPGDVIAQLASTIAATGVGLFLRQWLMTLDPAESAQDAAAQELFEEVRSRAAEVRFAQQAMLDMVQAFVATRRELFEEEVAASKRYVDRLEAGAAALGRIAEYYPDKLESLLGSAQQTYHTMVTTGIESAARLREGFEGQVRQLGEALETTANSYQRRLSDLDTLIVRYPEATAAIVAATDGASGAIDSMKRTVAQVAQELQAVSAALAAVPDDLRLVSVSGAKASEELHLRVKRLLADADQISGTMEQLVTVVDERLAHLARA